MAISRCNEHLSALMWGSLLGGVAGAASYGILNVRAKLSVVVGCTVPVLAMLASINSNRSPFKTKEEVARAFRDLLEAQGMNNAQFEVTEGLEVLWWFPEEEGSTRGQMVTLKPWDLTPSIIAATFWDAEVANRGLEQAAYCKVEQAMKNKLVRLDYQADVVDSRMGFSFRGRVFLSLPIALLRETTLQELQKRIAMAYWETSLPVLLNDLVVKAVVPSETLDLKTPTSIAVVLTLGGKRGARDSSIGLSVAELRSESLIEICQWKIACLESPKVDVARDRIGEYFRVFSSLHRNPPPQRLSYGVREESNGDLVYVGWKSFATNEWIQDGGTWLKEEQVQEMTAERFDKWMFGNFGVSPITK